MSTASFLTSASICFWSCRTKWGWSNKSPECTELSRGAFYCKWVQHFIFKKKNVLSLLSKVKLHSLASKSHTSMAVFIPILYVHTIFWCYYSWLIRFIQAVLRLSKEFGNTCLWIHSNWKVKWENFEDCHTPRRLSFDLIAHLEMEMVPKTLDVEDGSYQIYQY